MLYLHHHPLNLPFRFRSHSDPTPFPNRTFTVNRASTKHTVFTVNMLQFDGASKSKPVNAPSSNPTRSNNHKSGVRKRFANIFGNKKRTETGVTDIQGENEVEENKSPMRIISPQVTKYDLLASIPTTTPRTKRCTFSFKKRHSNHDAKATVSTSLQPNEDDIVSASRGHLPVTDAPYQSPMLWQSQKDSVGLSGVNLPASPTRDSALMSHPIGKIEIESESESDEKFETPVSEGVSGRSGFFGKR